MHARRPDHETTHLPFVGRLRRYVSSQHNNHYNVTADAKSCCYFVSISPFTHLLTLNTASFCPPFSQSALLWFVTREAAFILLPQFNKLVFTGNIPLDSGQSLVYDHFHCNRKGTQHPVDEASRSARSPWLFRWRQPDLESLITIRDQRGPNSIPISKITVRIIWTSNRLPPSRGSGHTPWLFGGG